MTLDQTRALYEKISEDWPWGQNVEVAHDGMKGQIVGWYVTREGRPGLVIEQGTTIIVHVYPEGRVGRSVA